MPTTLDVFISSKMVELKEERDALFKLIPSLNYGDIKLHAWVFEEDAGAVGKPIRDVYLNALQNSALYLGLFWNQYGEYTIDEFDRATEWGMERHVYVKDVEASKRDSKLADFLGKHGAVINGITAKWFKTTDELCKAVQHSIENWISERLRFRSGSSAIFATDPDDLAEKPKILFGRDELLKDVHGLLEKREQVLLQGFGGMGKTALAAIIAANWIKDDKGSVLWLKAGSAEANALFEALARPFNAQQAIASQTGDAKTKVLRDLLRGCGATLLVLDDCWNNKTLFALLKAMPSDMALLVTARQRYPLPKIRQVDVLAPTDALALLAHHADSDLNLDPQAIALCNLLGNHAFALEIAGKTLKIYGWTPADLITQIKDAPDKMTMPLELSESGRENVAKLLEVSLKALDEETRKAFLAFGAFFAPQITPEMLNRYFVTKLLRKDKEKIEATNDRMKLALQIMKIKITDSLPIQKALDKLYLHGLAERLPTTNTSVSAYRIHDLAYNYVRAQTTNDLHLHAIEACLSYTEQYNQPSPTNFAALRPELDNLLGAATWAFENRQNIYVGEFAWNLYVNSQFLVYSGFYGEAITLLKQAAEIASNLGNKDEQISHLGNLAITYLALGQIEQAIFYSEQVLRLQDETADNRFKSNTLGNLGNAYFELGQVEQAISYHEQALVISHEIEDKRGEALSLGNLGNAYQFLERKEEALSYYERALVISHEIEDKKLEGSSLIGLGIVYSSLGKLEKALSYYERALVISREIGDKRGESNALSNLGIIHRSIKQSEKAMSYYQEAIIINRILGDKLGEASNLNNLANIYNEMRDYPQALQYYQQAMIIYSDIGAHRDIETVNRSFVSVQEKMGGNKTT